MIWQFGMSERAAHTLEALEDSRPARFAWVNLGELREATARSFDAYPSHELWEAPSAAFSLMPTPILKVTDPTFKANYLRIQNYCFASARLRRAFDAEDGIVRYRQVDTSPSVPEVRDVGYFVFDVIKFGNPFDPERMVGEERDARQPDGSLRREWIMNYAERLQKGPEVYFRTDFVPPAPIFRATGTLWTFVTDELADRVMRAGIDDVYFRDITGPNKPVRDRMRRLL